MNVSIELITPEMAKEYLSKNTDNYRGISQFRVASYAKDMAAGKWELNGEAIKFNEDGKLSDGQHRLSAIVKAGVPVQMLVIRGVKNDVKIYDVAQKRTLFQIAKNSGISKAAVDSCCIGAVNILLSSTWMGNDAARKSVLDFCREHDDIISKSLCIVRAGSSKPIAKKSACLLLTLYLLQNGHDENTVEKFFRIINTGFYIDGVENTPAIICRSYLLDATYGKVTGGSSATKNASIFSVAYNAFSDFEKGIKRQKAYKPDIDRAKFIRVKMKMEYGLYDETDLRQPREEERAHTRLL